MTIKQFKPLLAEVADLSKVQFPVYASVKIDGIRGLIRGGLVSRKLLPIPNREIYLLLSQPEFEGFDGEMTVGSPTDPLVFNKSGRVTGKAEHPLPSDFTFWVFDDCSNPDAPFSERLHNLTERVYKHGNGYVQVLPQRLCHTLEELLAFEEDSVVAGWEGVMIRKPDAPYKFGRSTNGDQALLKVKRFVDSEFEVLEVYEQMTNNNAAEKDALGHTKRSTSKAGKVPAGTLGGFRGRDIHSGVEFKVGGGWNNAQAAEMWSRREGLPGTIHTYRYQAVGVLNKPRFPQWKGERPGFDVEVKQ